MKPQDRAARLRSLREEVAALHAVKCRMSHERVLRRGEHMLPVASRLPGVEYERVGLCALDARARMPACSHTTARVKLKEAVRELGARGRQVETLAGELNLLDNEIHLLDYRKGAAEKSLAVALEEAHRVGGQGGGGAPEQVEREVRELELLHDAYVEQIESLKDRVVAELDALIEQAAMSRSTKAEDADA